MNILFLTIVPKAELYSSLADEFKRRGHNVTFVSPHEGETCISNYDGHRILYFHAGKMINVGILRKGINNFCFPAHALSAVKACINPADYQLILMSTPPLGYLSAIQYLKRNNPSIKFYLILRDIHPEGATFVLKKIPGLFYYFKKQAQTLYDIADYIGCMSPHSVRLIQERYLLGHQGKVRLLPNWGRDAEYRKPSNSVKAKYGIEGKFLLIYGGNMGIAQNLSMFISLAEKKKSLDDVVFFLIGKGTEKRKLKRLVSEKRLTNVRIEDYIPRDDYNDILRCADVGLISLHPRSYFANCPSKTISYWQNKIPILASIDKITDYGSYFIENSQSGLWSLADDEESLSLNFDKLYYNRELRREMGVNGYRYFMDHFTVDKTFNSIMSSLEEF